MAPTGGQVGNILLIIVQLSVIFSASRFFGALFGQMGHPLLHGEIAAVTWGWDMYL